MFYGTIFIASAATMVFEIAGARVLAPYLGTSTEVWAGIIATILGGLSAGYWIGGRVADAHPSRKVLALTMFLAGIAIALTWSIRDLVLSFLVLTPISLTFLTIGAGLVLFFPASLFLGAISPFVAKLVLTNLDQSATTIGRLSAVGTVGSIIGTIGASAWLIPHFGTNAILISTALVVMAWAGLLTRGPDRTKIMLFFPAALLVFWTLNFGIMSTLPHALATVDTPYNRVRITDHEMKNSDIKLRAVSTDPFGTQCASYILPDNNISDEIVFDYLKFFDLGLHFKPDSQHLLVIGGCNYSYPQHLLNIVPDASVDVVEIDPGMTEISKTYFGLTENPRLTIFHEDARRFIAREVDPYDIIFMDAFNSYAAIPFQLTTAEAMERLHALLSDDGILVVNVIGALDGELSNFLRAEVETLSAVFPFIDVFPVRSSVKTDSQNIVLIASKKAPSAPYYSFDSETAIMLKQRVSSTEIAPGLLLTDDYSPVEWLERARRAQVIESRR